ncbi:hypothetical protein CEQ30_16980 [Nocardia brasiliensis]|nr:hypothetical protein CEQ30_16980 [Nocardia brasiliensis]
MSSVGSAASATLVVTAYRHPHVVPLLAARPQTSPAALVALERLVTAMRAAGLPEQVVADAPMLLFAFRNGYLLAVTGAGRPASYPRSTARATRPWLLSLPGWTTSAPQRNSTGCSTPRSVASGTAVTEHYRLTKATTSSSDGT